VSGTPYGPGSLAFALRDAVAVLRHAGIDEAPFEARLLAAHALDTTPAALIKGPARDLGADEGERLRALVGRRAGREPMSHLLGRREFWSLEFEVTPDVLDPRPDSETLIEAVLAARPAREARHEILDLGTGGGCLLLALLHEYPNARGVGIDISAAAITIAARNAARLKLASRASFRTGDWGGALAARFGIIVANPPYIRSAAIASLQPEIARYEPRIALDGGSDGLDSYRRAAPEIARLLSDDGIAFAEVGVGQDVEVTQIFLANGLDICDRLDDLGGVRRCLVAVRNPKLTVV
jgi:release factor glutamine methyltransferase